MGGAGLRELMGRRERFDIRLLVRPTKANRKKMRVLEKESGVEIVWGDLTKYEDVLRAVAGPGERGGRVARTGEGTRPVDYVLHVGGMVSPKADKLPEQTMRVNVGAAENIVKAVKAQPNADRIGVVYIGSVAQTSDRNPPLHWGRTGDPITISKYDTYAVSKTIAERIFVEGGLGRWVCLRQSGILHPGVMNNFDPIMFHVPLGGVLEWATVEDSGRLLAGVCEEEVPDVFWNRFYNIGSGTEYRITNYEFMRRLLGAVSCPPPEKIFDPNWFALKNFHGQWYLDSDELERLVPFREGVSLDDYFERLRAALPGYFRLAKLAPAGVIKAVMRRLAHRKGVGTMDWVKSGNEEKTCSYFGSYEAWAAIPRKWAEVDMARPTDMAEEARRLEHGWDEARAGKVDIEDMRRAAEFRGGKCLSEKMEVGDWATPLEWECRGGHKFEASPTLVLRGGHWCPECLEGLLTHWNTEAIAEGNPFVEQVRGASRKQT